MVRPKKHLGQHFLADPNIARKIVSYLSKEAENVCELGPGTGVLTKPLLEREEIKTLVLVEVDLESIDYLEANIKDDRLSLLHADFLKLDLSRISKNPFALIGNFPYNISSQIFFRVIENRNLVPEVVCMIQKEVAERIVAPHGNKTYGILSVFLQSWYNIEYCFTVNENVFVPPPKVKSAVIRLKRNNIQQLGCNEELFMKVVKSGFNHRRKTLRNSLQQFLNEETKQMPILGQRAEQLSIEEFVLLTHEIEKNPNYTGNS
jgi:16S rRNA (adenine1518-N6/adenine1519-N6)-dimethyltransferase